MGIFSQPTRHEFASVNSPPIDCVFKSMFMLITKYTSRLVYLTICEGRPLVTIRFLSQNDDVIKWIHFPRYWPFVRGIHRSPVNSPHKGQRRGALIFSLICAWINVFSKQSRHWWFETPLNSLWRHCDTGSITQTTFPCHAVIMISGKRMCPNICVIPATMGGNPLRSKV